MHFLFSLIRGWESQVKVLGWFSGEVFDGSDRGCRRGFQPLCRRFRAVLHCLTEGSNVASDGDGDRKTRAGSRAEK